jgi:GH24 family phage-related lysozyme (muramidase)
VYRIGYGTRRLSDDTTITRAEARARVRRHIMKEVLPTFADVDLSKYTSRQRAVLIDFVYNVGRGTYRQSAVYRRLCIQSMDMSDALRVSIHRLTPSGYRRSIGLQARRDYGVLLWEYG